MFYEASSVNNFLLCDVCEGTLNDPRVLPCGKFICLVCIDFLLDSDRKIIKCRDCGKTHEVPNEGFAKNEKLTKFTGVKASEISRGPKFSELKKVKNFLHEITETIEYNLNSGDTEIRKHCDEARNKVQLATEEAHYEVSNTLKEFLDKIDEYEKECIKKLKNQNRNKIEDLLRMSNQFDKEYELVIKQNIVEDSELDALQANGVIL